VHPGIAGFALSADSMISRRAWLLLHRWAGLFMALFLVVAGLTGSVIAFQDEFDRLLNPRLLVVEPRGEPLSPVALRELALKHAPRGEINFLNLWRKPDESAAFLISPRRDTAPPRFNAIYLDPYSGEFLGGRNLREAKLDREHIISFLYELHYTMALPEPWGRWLFGFVALLWTLDCFVGFYLTLPRRRRAFLRRWKPAWLVKWGASPVRINFDIHRAAALWTWVMLLVLAVSSVQLNLQREVFDPVFTAIFPVENVRGQFASHQRPPGAGLLPWDEALERGRELMQIRARRDGFSIEQETSLGLSAPRAIYAYRVRSSLDIDDRYGRTMVYFSALDGSELAFEHPRLASGNLITRWLVMLHFGHVWGLPFRIFIFLMGIVVAALSITGVIIWWRKRRSRTPGAASQPTS
jgi:uncharacterized iron-regulated membrane protein